MANIKDIKDKQGEKLKGKTTKEIALTAARRAMQEIRSKHDLAEPDQLASGKSDMHGKMVVEKLTPDDETYTDEKISKDSSDD